MVIWTCPDPGPPPAPTEYDMAMGGMGGATLRQDSRCAVYVEYSTVEPAKWGYHVRLGVEPHCMRVERQTSTLQDAGAEVGQCKTQWALERCGGVRRD